MSTAFRAKIRRLRLSGWPTFAIAHLLRSNYPQYSPRWIYVQMVNQLSQDKQKAAKQ